MGDRVQPLTLKLRGEGGGGCTREQVLQCTGISPLVWGGLSPWHRCMMGSVVYSVILDLGAEGGKTIFPRKHQGFKATPPGALYSAANTPFPGGGRICYTHVCPRCTWCVPDTWVLCGCVWGLGVLQTGQGGGLPGAVSQRYTSIPSQFEHWKIRALFPVQASLRVRNQSPSLSPWGRNQNPAPSPDH